MAQAPKCCSVHAGYLSTCKLFDQRKAFTYQEGSLCQQGLEGRGGWLWSSISAPFLWESCILLSFLIVIPHPMSNFDESCFPGAVNPTFYPEFKWNPGSWEYSSRLCFKIIIGYIRDVSPSSRWRGQLMNDLLWRAPCKDCHFWQLIWTQFLYSASVSMQIYVTKYYRYIFKPFTCILQLKQYLPFHSVKDWITVC